MRQDKKKTEEAIKLFMKEYLVKNKRFPTYREISAGTGLSMITMKRKCKNIDLTELSNTHVTKFQIDRLIQSLYIHAEKGNVKAFDRYMQLVFNWLPSQSIELTGEIKTRVTIEDFKKSLESVEE